MPEPPEPQSMIVEYLPCRHRITLPEMAVCGVVCPECHEQTVAWQWSPMEDAVPYVPTWADRLRGWRAYAIDWAIDLLERWR